MQGGSRAWMGRDEYQVCAFSSLLPFILSHESRFIENTLLSLFVQLIRKTGINTRRARTSMDTLREMDKSISV